jgi:hypothetical protein
VGVSLGESKGNGEEGDFGGVREKREIQREETERERRRESR